MTEFLEDISVRAQNISQIILSTESAVIVLIETTENFDEISYILDQTLSLFVFATGFHVIAQELSFSSETLVLVSNETSKIVSAMDSSLNFLGGLLENRTNLSLGCLATFLRSIAFLELESYIDVFSQVSHLDSSFCRKLNERNSRKFLEFSGTSITAASISSFSPFDETTLETNGNIFSLRNGFRLANFTLSTVPRPFSSDSLAVSLALFQEGNQETILTMSNSH